MNTISNGKPTATRYLIFDESGNLGHSGRYFVISCIDTSNYKPLSNIMKRKIGTAKQLFRELAELHENEVKAKDAYPCIKYHIAECIVKKELTISYIVADLPHVKPTLLEDKNIFYNYLMRLLIDRLISAEDNGTQICIMYDQHTTKVGSTNSLEEYLKLHLLYDKGYDITLSFKSYDSNASDAFHIQAADYVANAIYSHYEYGVSDYFNLYYPKLLIENKFPYRAFGD